MKILVTIPAYNEEKTIGEVIKRIRATLDELPYENQIIVVNDGSTDNTIQEAEKAGAFIFSHKRNYGLAETYRTEIKVALDSNPDIIIHIDADGQYRPEEIPILIEPILKREADLVLGSRFLGSIEEMPLLKKIGNRAFSKVISNITKLKITDGQTGFRAFTKEVGEKIKIISTHTYTQEMIIRVAKEKYSIVEIPVHFDRRNDGKSRLISNPLEYAIRGWITILRVYRDYEPLNFFGGIGCLLILCGTLVFSYVVYILYVKGIVILSTRIPTLLLGLLLFISGVQIVLFGFLADMKINFKE
ncbi:MAG TPA: glycosyltransferase family 2 protein [Methanofastidiosum sp.]|nr:glycosyltransferase family 2 protein [Methanofastidiosum sp.]